MLSDKEILQIFQNSGSEEKSELSQDAYIPSNRNEPISSDGYFTEIAQNNFSFESENEENLSINIDSHHAITSGRRSQKRNRKLRESQELTSVSPNELNEEVAKDESV
ncbi:hypothetical protein AVEN_86238-1 [Araneus ventricosus]|uniref:Uncharacterized protein n=1 Tax=Araneus ventricosus TaxID=182803 RepID=A0A4Y2IPM8_ARAVE|nr:hypothetical protein AVEN_86238-1 [Araneus ventricosus]